MLRTIEKWCDRALNAVLALILLTIVVVTLAQVLYRYVIGGSFTWSEELNLLLWAWMIALAAIKARHLRISMFVSAMPYRLQAVLYVFRWFLTLGFLFVLFRYGLGMVELTKFDRYVELDFIARSWLFTSIVVCVVPWSLVATVRMLHALALLKQGRDPMEGR